MKTALAHKLDVMACACQDWIDFDRKVRDREELETNDGTHIMSPPVWPSHGMLKEWVKTLNEAREDALR